MVATLNVNPIQTTNAAGTFSITLDGYIQGMVMDDPAVRYQLTGGQLDPAETSPMWGGCAIYEELVTGEPSNKPLVKHATSATLLTGFSVFNQNSAMINTPQSPVPLALPGMQVNLYRFGSNARIAVQADPALAALLSGVAINAPVLYWDPINFYVTETTTSNYALPTSIKTIGWNSGNSMTVSYSSGTGYATWTRTGNCVLLQI